MAVRIAILTQKIIAPDQLIEGDGMPQSNPPKVCICGQPLDANHSASRHAAMLAEIRRRDERQRRDRENFFRGR